MQKRVKLFFWIVGGLFSAMMLMSASMYLFNHEEIAAEFLTLGHPAYIVYPLAIAKILAVIAILSRKSQVLKEWAYAGLFFDFLLALAAHISVGDGDFPGALIAMVLLFATYFLDKKAFPKA